MVPSRDSNGHGTFLAGVAAGNENLENGFTGVAPLAELCIVKCKEAKQNIKDYYRISSDSPCFMETDLMTGVQYLLNVALETRMPVVICLGVGTNQGGHDEGGSLGTLLRNVGDRIGVVVVACGGNEGNTAHHFRSDILEERSETDVELRVGAQEKGFTMELWSDAPGLYSVGLISPSGEYTGKIQARLWERREIRFLFENTVVNIDYLLLARESGDECIRIRFQNPEEGIWRLRVFNDTEFSGRFDLWLPIRDFVGDATYFLEPDPDVTICEPGNNEGVITVSFYNGGNQGTAVDSSRGYTRSGNVKPDLAAPGIEIFGPLPRLGAVYPSTEQERLDTARYGYRSGSSMAAAVTAGACTLMLEWGLIRGNDLTMDSVVIQKYLIRGAERTGRAFPNRQWGYGTLDLYGVYKNISPGPE